MSEFKIEKCTFCGEKGAQVIQIRSGREVVRQFVPSDCLRDFCAQIGEPELYTKYISLAGLTPACLLRYTIDN